MSYPRYTPEFMAEAVRQVIQREYSVREVAERVGVSAHSLYKWVREARPKHAGADELAATKLEN
jgi:transposase